MSKTPYTEDSSLQRLREAVIDDRAFRENRPQVEEKAETPKPGTSASPQLAREAATFRSKIDAQS